MISRKENNSSNLFKIFLGVCIGIIIITGFLVMFDDHSAANTFNKDFEVVTEYSIRHRHITEVRNKRTGAHYYISADGQITPVYNFNGTVKTSEAGE